MISPLASISNTELGSLIERYPWFAAARLEQCRRGAGEGRSLFAETAAWAGSLRMLYNMAHGLEKAEEQEAPAQAQAQEPLQEPVRRRVRVAGGDFFSQDQYDDVRTESDALISDIAASVGEEAGAPVPFCTETLGQIYAEQGYTAQAKYIYSQLILRYPEKSAYFAALIDQLDEE